MKTNVVRIGNSRGIRIPKKLLEECRLEDTVELEAHKDHLVVRSAAKPRSGWEEAFRRMAEAHDDVLLDQESLDSTNPPQQTEKPSCKDPRSAARKFPAPDNSHDTRSALPVPTPARILAGGRQTGETCSKPATNHVALRGEPQGRTLVVRGHV